MKKPHDPLRALEVEKLTPLEARMEWQTLGDEIAQHDVRYHQEDQPTISDAAYDALRRRFDAIMAAFPELQKEASPLARVGAKPSEKFSKVKHAVQMLSLANTFSDEELSEFVERVRRFLDWPSSRELSFTAEPKIDGLSCSLRFEKGVLTVAATRGDGEEGEDVTANVRTIHEIPHRLHGLVPEIIDIRGEIYMATADFLKLNERQDAHTDSGVIAGFTASEPLYLYTSLQNTSASNTSYASYAVNDGGHTAYGELGINNANYSYSAAGFPNNGFSTPLATFVQSFGGPLVLGSWDSQKISFIVNGAVNTADAMTIETTGAVTIPTAAVTGGAINGATIGGTTPAAGTFTTLTSPILKSATGSATTGVSLDTPLGAQATIIDIGDGTRPLRLNGGSAGAVNTAGVSSSVGILQLSGSNSDVRTFTGGRGATLQFNVLHTASAVDYVQVTGATTASKVVAISAQGSDTDVTLSLAPKGAGTIRFGTYTAGVLTPTGYITITDSGGTSRRLLVG